MSSKLETTIAETGHTKNCYPLSAQIKTKTKLCYVVKMLEVLPKNVKYYRILADVMLMLNF